MCTMTSRSSLHPPSLCRTLQTFYDNMTGKRPRKRCETDCQSICILKGITDGLRHCHGRQVAKNGRQRPVWLVLCPVHCVSHKHKIALVPWHLPLDIQEVALRVHLRRRAC